MNVNIKNIGIIILLFSFLEPEYFFSIPMIHIVFTIIRILSIILLIFVYINLKEISKFSLIFMSFYLLLSIITYLKTNGEYLGAFVNDSIPTIALILWLDILLRKDSMNNLRNLNIVYSSLIYINFLLLLINPDGYNTYYSPTGLLIREHFLGVYNQFGTVLFPGLVVNVLYSIKKYNKFTLKTYLLLFTILTTFLLVDSATSILGIILFLFYFFFIYKKPLMRAVSLKVLFSIYIVVFFIIVIFNYQHLFSFMIEKVLGRDLTFSTRIIIWDHAINMIKNSFIVGYGYFPGGQYISITSEIFKSAHNTILQILLQGGLLSLSVIILLLVIVTLRLDREKKDLSSNFIIYSIFTIAILMLMEVYPYQVVFILLLLGYYNKHIKYVNI